MSEQYTAAVNEIRAEIDTVRVLLSCHLSPGNRAVKEAYLACLEAELEELLS